MKSYTITVNGKVYEVTVEENTGAPKAPAAPAAPAFLKMRKFPLIFIPENRSEKC